MAEAWPQAAGLGSINEYLGHANAASAFGRASHARLLSEPAGVADETVLRLTATAHARVRLTTARTVAGALADHADFARAAFTTTLARVTALGGRPARLGVPVTTPLARQINRALLDDAGTYASLAEGVLPLGTVIADAGLIDRLLGAAGSEPAADQPVPTAVGRDLTVVKAPLAAGVEHLGVSAAAVSGAGRPAAAAWSGLQADARQTAALAAALAVAATRALNTAPLPAEAHAATRSVITSAAAVADRAAAIASWERPAGALPAGSQAELTAVAVAGAQLSDRLDDLLEIDWDVPVLTAPPRPAGQLRQLAEAVRAIDPVATVLAAVQQRAQPAPQPGVDGLPPAGLHARPTFVRPGFEHLVALGVDYVCPGLGDLGDNTVSLLEANQAAVESFLVGFNDELAGELLWREYPAVLTDTWLRRFWNYPAIGADDITPVADWTAKRDLGAGAGAGDAVVFIRGDLLVRYPTALVYLLPGVATRRGKATVISPNYASPIVPSFIATVGRGARAYGFPVDVSTLAADPTNLDGGYFVVIEEHAAETRFGLDAPAAARVRRPAGALGRRRLGSPRRQRCRARRAHSRRARRVAPRQAHDRRRHVGRRRRGDGPHHAAPPVPPDRPRKDPAPVMTSIDLSSPAAGPVRAAYARLDTGVPLVLAPVRLETRVLAGKPARLAIRVFPDQLHLDQHDPALTDVERRLGAEYWTAQRATTSLDEQLARWEALAAELGAHRAAYVATVTEDGDAGDVPSRRVGPVRGPAPAAALALGRLRIPRRRAGLRRRRRADPARPGDARRRGRRARLAHRLPDRPAGRDGRRGRCSPAPPAGSSTDPTSWWWSAPVPDSIPSPAPPSWPPRCSTTAGRAGSASPARAGRPTPSPARPPGPSASNRLPSRRPCCRPGPTRPAVAPAPSPPTHSARSSCRRSSSRSGRPPTAPGWPTPSGLPTTRCCPPCPMAATTTSGGCGG